MTHRLACSAISKNKFVYVHNFVDSQRFIKCFQQKNKRWFDTKSPKLHQYIKHNCCAILYIFIFICLCMNKTDQHGWMSHGAITVDDYFYRNNIIQSGWVARIPTAVRIFVRSVNHCFEVFDENGYVYFQWLFCITYSDSHLIVDTSTKQARFCCHCCVTSAYFCCIWHSSLSIFSVVYKTKAMTY